MGRFGLTTAWSSPGCCPLTRRKMVDHLAGCLQGNLDRMDYPTYRAQGLRVGSGAIESANFHVTGGRHILQGVRWSDAGARQMAALRADLFNGVLGQRTRQILTKRAA